MFRDSLIPQFRDSPIPHSLLKDSRNDYVDKVAKKAAKCIRILRRSKHLFHKDTLKKSWSPFCASVLLITLGRLLDLKLLKFRMFLIFLSINATSYSFRTIASQNSVKYSECSWYCKKYRIQDVNKAFVYITDCTPPLKQFTICFTSFCVIIVCWYGIKGSSFS